MIRILVAEDDSAMNKLVCNMLTDKGYEPVACFDGAQAMREFERQPFDMVITDIMMPNADGYRLAEEVRQTDKHIPILFMTALDDKLSQQRGFRSGADDYVTKPFDADILLLRVEALLRRANIERSRELQNRRKGPGTRLRFGGAGRVFGRGLPGNRVEQPALQRD